MALDDYGYYDENGKFIKFKARKYRRRGVKTYKVAPLTYEQLAESFPSLRETDKPNNGLSVLSSIFGTEPEQTI